MSRKCPSFGALSVGTAASHPGTFPAQHRSGAGREPQPGGTGSRERNESVGTKTVWFFREVFTDSECLLQKLPSAASKPRPFLEQVLCLKTGRNGYGRVTFAWLCVHWTCDDLVALGERTARCASELSAGYVSRFVSSCACLEVSLHG